MESFDSLGRLRSVEQIFDEQTGDKLGELPIDTVAVVRITPEDDAPVADAMELNQRILASEKVEACLATNYFRFVVRRSERADTQDACAIADLSAGFKDADIGLAKSFQRIAQYASFFRRKVGPR
jgi:hypothetical protein